MCDERVTDQDSRANETLDQCLRVVGAGHGPLDAIQPEGPAVGLELDSPVNQ